MSLRSINSICQRSSSVSDPSSNAEEICSAAEQTPAPSLESLLASCGALQSALRQNGDTDSSEDSNPRERHMHDAEACCEKVAECDLDVDSANPAVGSSETLLHQESFDAATANSANPADVASFMNALRQELRESLSDLRSMQSAAAESQSAVLKTLTEIIFQSSSMRDGSGTGLEQKLAEAEVRILHRINQVAGGARAGEAKPSITSSHATSTGSPPAKINPSRSWAEIRDKFMIDGGEDEAQEEPDLKMPDKSSKEHSRQETATAELERPLDVPRAIDPETVSEQELRTAFYEREAFISTLLGRLRQQHQKSSEHLPAEQLLNMAEYLPEELAAQVYRTLHQLDQLARVGELELSLERARLSRQLSQLDHARQVIEHNARQLGLTLAVDGTLSNPQNLTMRSNGSRRWLSKLGFGQ